MLQIEVDNWAMTAGLIGLARLLEDRTDIIDNKVVRISAEDITDVAKLYVHKLLRDFSLAERERQRLKNMLNRLYRLRESKNLDKYKETRKQIQNAIHEQFKKVAKYFPDSAEKKEIESILDRLKGMNTFEHLETVGREVEQYIHLLSTPPINEKLTLNHVKVEILGPLYGQASILQKTFYSKSTEEHISRIQQDFVQPACLELQFHEVRQKATGADEIVSFLEEHKQNYKPFKDWLRAVKKMKSDAEVFDYFDNRLLHCMFIPELPATQSYEEMVFSPLALSRENAINFHWNFEYKFPAPISAVARLVLFMVPFGVAYYPRRLGSPEANEIFRFAGLITTQEPLAEIRKLNDYYKAKREGTGGEATFAESIVGIFQETKYKAKELSKPYFTIFEFYADGKKTLLDYYHMPPYVATYFARYGNALKLLFQYDLRDEFVRMVLRGIDPKRVVFQYLRLVIKNNASARDAIIAVRERKRILNARKDVNGMDKQDGQIWVVYHKGLELQKKFVSNRSGEQEDGQYHASGRKKLEGISYRLLNAVKSGNRHGFMDTVFRLYMSQNEEIPSIFVNVFTDDGLDFETIGSAFIAGLLGEEFKDEKDKEVPA